MVNVIAYIIKSTGLGMSIFFIIYLLETISSGTTYLLFMLFLVGTIVRLGYELLFFDEIEARREKTEVEK